MAAIGSGTAANGRQYSRKVSSFTRPNDTTAYAAGDLVANSATAGSVTPLSWGTSGSRPFDAPAIRLHKTGATGATFRIYLFSASPTVSTTGDNGSFDANVNNSADVIAIYEGVLYGMKDGSVGLLVPISGVIQREYVGDPTTVYGLVRVGDAYTPIAQEVFTASLVMEFDQ
jgi:hypothetical protein